MSTAEQDELFISLQRRIRLVVLLNAAELAGLSPISVLRLHAFAYLSNVLAPVWDMPVLDGKLLKRRGGPFYPSLQRDLDRLIGLGVVVISGLTHVHDEENHWRLEGAYRLNRRFAEPILSSIASFGGGPYVAAFVQELAYALSALTESELDRAFLEDATYSDPNVDIGNVVDFAEWQDLNYSARAARFFDRLMPGRSGATPGEKLHLYVRHLHRRMNAGRSE